MYRRLDSARIVDTARRLASRVSERVPDSGLSRVAAELVQVAERAAADEEWFRRPHRWLRAGVGALILILITVVGLTLAVLLPRPAGSSIADVLQMIESAVNDLVFIGIAIYFLVTVEVRRKRRRALKAVHELRSMAHIIDMHQLTKDPERVMNPAFQSDTPSSPVRVLSAFQLSRYLDYSSEMLSLLSKSAALYVQDFDDPVTISAVNEIENLTSGLSRKIWQKIMILDRELADAESAG
jgi:hypothetical protein